MKQRSIVILRSNPVAPDPRVEKEANSLIKAGYYVKVLAWDRGSNYSCNEAFLELDAGRAMVYRLGIRASYGEGFKNLKAFLLFQLRLFVWLVKNKNSYDVIHACDFDTAFTANLCARLLKKKLVFDIFDYLFSNNKDGLNLYQKSVVYFQQKIINSADGTIICTDQRKEQIKGSIPKMLAVIHNSPPILNCQLQKYNLNQDKIKIVYVGILQDFRFLKELAEVIRTNPDWELHIAGFGKYEDYFVQMARNYPNIIYYGKISYKKALELENSCDIMTAIYDPTIENHRYAAPNKFYEALMLGKPLIMVKGTGMIHIVEENRIGEVIEYNTDSLREAIYNLVGRKNEWPEISKKMRQLYEKEYSWNCMEKRLLNLYSKIFENDQV
jgi:glycosyltransferase involved in cell wall biosynthesis